LPQFDHISYSNENSWCWEQQFKAGSISEQTSGVLGFLIRTLIWKASSLSMGNGYLMLNDLEFMKTQRRANEA